MRDVADRAGVSFKTVSRVVNDEPGVRPAKAERVRAAIDELGYRLDDGARSLRSTDRSTKTIGFVQVDHGNPFFSALYAGLERVARSHGYLVLSASTDKDPDREQDLIRAFVSRRVDGLVVVGSSDNYSYLQSELDRGTPMVFVDLPPLGLEVALVRTDHRLGARQATEHLVEQGHRHIAYMGDEVRWFSAQERLAGFFEALETAGIKPDERLVVPGLPDSEAARAAAREILQADDPPTAIFASQNLVCMGAIQALHELGRQHDVALVGFDDLDIATLIEPQISVVPQHPVDLAARAGELLFDQIAGNEHCATVELIAHDVIARGSGEIPGPFANAS